MEWSCLVWSCGGGRRPREESIGGCSRQPPGPQPIGPGGGASCVQWLRGRGESEAGRSGAGRSEAGVSATWRRAGRCAGALRPGRPWRPTVEFRRIQM
ncbi:hypothetical protein TMO_a0455 (plasmid) [Tistrella mobilis KA081020-065]|uniref:Uncharacterized protein n=1 Tax=Tistrella mobilis (strain KA081020-065) TaxID=1110502 RepID=I3TSX0_TISMK|nr:hypothetical protein TMO_a0455 [Tistrella mobilis KA081020-065]